MIARGPSNDLRTTLVALAALLLWDASGADLAVMHTIGSARGFPWRDGLWTAGVAHEGGRWLAWGLLAALASDAWRAPRCALGQPSRAERWRWLLVTTVCLLAVPALKRLSPTSCPWDLADFGGVATHVSHWRALLWRTPDGGPGHCFPSGHAVAAFAFLGQYFLWQPHRPQHARRWLLGVLCAGALFGLAQTLRGAHFPSHTLWSAWVCWALCAAAAARPAGLQRARATATPPHVGDMLG